MACDVWPALWGGGEGGGHCREGGRSHWRGGVGVMEGRGHCREGSLKGRGRGHCREGGGVIVGKGRGHCREGEESL